jgi:hypothetical protein
MIQTKNYIYLVLNTTTLSVEQNGLLNSLFLKLRQTQLFKTQGSSKNASFYFILNHHGLAGNNYVGFSPERVINYKDNAVLIVDFQQIVEAIEKSIPKIIPYKKTILISILEERYKF